MDGNYCSLLISASLYLLFFPLTFSMVTQSHPQLLTSEPLIFNTFTIREQHTPPPPPPPCRQGILLKLYLWHSTSVSFPPSHRPLSKHGTRKQWQDFTNHRCYICSRSVIVSRWEVNGKCSFNHRRLPLHSHHLSTRFTLPCAKPPGKKHMHASRPLPLQDRSSPPTTIWGGR